MNKVIILSAVVLALLANAKDVKAHQVISQAKAADNTRIVDLVPQPKLHRNRPIDKCIQYGGHPELSYYLDGDTPIDTAYSDYLEDVQWFIGEHSQSCKVVIEFLP